MRKLLLSLLCLVGIAAYGQELPNSGFDKARIIETDRVIQMELKPVGNKPHLKKELFYAWYGANAIHLTQGGYSGHLLNGWYNEFYLNKNLKIQGFYKSGLKTGLWKEWKEDGSVEGLVTWKNGIILPDSTTSFWKRLPLINRKKRTTGKSAVGGHGNG